MSKRPTSLHALHKDHTILDIKSQMNKITQSKQIKNLSQAIKQRFKTYNHFSLIYLNSISQDLQPQKLISHLKQLKALSSFSIDIAYLLLVLEHYIYQIFDSLKSLKNLSVIRLELRDLSSLFQASSLRTLCKTLPILNNLFRVQVKFPLQASQMTISEGMRLRTLLESLCKLERLTFMNLILRSSVDIAPILEAIETFKTSKALRKVSLTFDKCKLYPSNRLRELFLTLEEIKSLKDSQVLFKECDVPGYTRLITIVPLLKETGKNGDIKITFDDCNHTMTRIERLLFFKSVENIKSSHKIQVYSISKLKIRQNLTSPCCVLVSFLFFIIAIPLIVARVAAILA